MRLPKFMWRLMQIGPRAAYRHGQGKRLAGTVLILTTTGRKSGLPRETPVQYEEIDGAMLIGSARGQQADWFRNILADPHVQVQIGDRTFSATAEPITDPARIADILEIRYQRRPRMVGMILRADGVRVPPSREGLEEYVAGLAMVAIYPDAA